MRWIRFGTPCSLGLYEKAMPSGLTWEEMLRDTAEGGFDTLEISIDESDYRLSRLDWDRNQRIQLRHASEQAGIPIRTMCLSGHRKYPFGSHDPAIRRRSRQIMEKAVDLAGDIGVRIIQLAGYDVYYETGDGDTRRWFAENLQYAAEYAARSGVLLGFETMETPFMDTVDKAMYWVKKVDSPYLGVYPDIGNLKNASVVYETDMLADLKAGWGSILAAHLKETKPGIYRNLDFGTGHTEYIPCIRMLWDMGVRHYTGEFWYQQGDDHRKKILAASEFLRERIEAAAKGEVPHA